MESELVNGVTHIINYDNIAIGVLMIVSIAEGTFIVKLVKALLGMKDTMQNVAIAINTLNERLNKHD